MRIFVMFMVNCVCQNRLNSLKRHQDSFNCTSKEASNSFSNIRIAIKVIYHGRFHPIVHAKHQRKRERTLRQRWQHSTIQIKESLALDLMKCRPNCTSMKHLSKYYLVNWVSDCNLNKIILYSY